MSWTYNCANFGSSGNFEVNITQPPGDLTLDLGPNELGMSGSGTDTYTDTGVFSLEVNSECAWIIAINSSGTPAPAPSPDLRSPWGLRRLPMEAATGLRIQTGLSHLMETQLVTAESATSL